MILFGYDASDKKRYPKETRKSLLNYYDLIDQAKGDEIATKLGAVKFVECDKETGRGAKVLMDEIAYAGLGKVLERNERSKSSCCSAM